jgi:arylsulfatase
MNSGQMMWAWSTCLVASLGLVLGACSTAEPQKPPSVLLITIDTLRSEHLGCYGYYRDTTPHIDALAENSIVFDRALVSMATTLPSHLSMLTGLYSHQHGVTSNRGGVTVPFVSEPGRQSVAVALQTAGYRTAAFVSAPPLDRSTGIAAGFDTYVQPDPASGSYVFAADQTTEAARTWLRNNEDEPFFLWVHYWDPHTVNAPQPPYAGMFQGDARQREWLRARGIDPAILTHHFGREPLIAKRYLQSKGGPEGFEINWDDLGALFDRYDGDVRNVDDRIGELLGELDNLGLGPRTIVAITADHGQSLGEDDWLGHALISEVNSFVPWILHIPGETARRIDRLVSLVDLMPTIVTQLKLPSLNSFLVQAEGRDVLAANFDRDHALTAQQPKTLAKISHPGATALITERWRLILDDEGETRLEDLLDLGAGDVSEREPGVTGELTGTLQEILARGRTTAAELEATETEALLDALEQLGYTEERK